jgi:antitoxin CcdA
LDFVRNYYAHNHEGVMSIQSTAKRPTNLSLDASLLTEARSFRVNLSQAAEAGLRRAIAEAKAEQWRHENAGALADSNNWVEANGLPLDRYRQF